MPASQDASTPSRLRIAVIYGGRSSEHSISTLSAASVLAALDPLRYDVVTIGITRDGRWLSTVADPTAFARAGRRLPEVVDGQVDPARALAAGGHDLARSAGPAAFQALAADSAAGALRAVDVVFPVLHGAFGEDGTIQGLLEMAGVPYVGSGVLASAASMDKAFTKTVLAAAGLDVGRHVVVHRGQPFFAADAAQLGYPVFVKPARAGSSVGISKVNTGSELPDALELAFSHDRKIIIEAAVAGREVECGVLQDADGTVTASLPAEIRLRPGFEWYSFEAKYLDDACEFLIPADLPSETIKTLQQHACDAFRALECEGLARVDFFVTGDGQIIVNEVNTMPGFTPISMYPRMWAESGVGYPELIGRLVATALVDQSAATG
jgi:D-alanine-D-alanine ligase